LGCFRQKSLKTVILKVCDSLIFSLFGRVAQVSPLRPGGHAMGLNSQAPTRLGCFLQDPHKNVILRTTFLW
jgi:hypothetical protein